MGNRREVSRASINGPFSVDTVLKMCGLEKFADAVVGSLGVEHRKRTTIGVELAAKVRNERRAQPQGV